MGYAERVCAGDDAYVVVVLKISGAAGAAGAVAGREGVVCIGSCAGLVDHVSGGQLGGAAEPGQGQGGESGGVVGAGEAFGGDAALEEGSSDQTDAVAPAVGTVVTVGVLRAGGRYVDSRVDEGGNG